MATKFYYDEGKNPDGAQHIYGVPLSDMTDEQYEALPKWLQAQVKASPMYVTKNPKPEPKAKEDGQQAADKPGNASAGEEG